jgi:sec-independent protein translocase protein TatB
MFDIGFWELVLIAVVALLVIGPERLPKVARMAGLWMGRARRTLASVKEEIDRELKAQELKEILEKQARSNPLESILEEPTADPPPSASKPSVRQSGVEPSPGEGAVGRRDRQGKDA